MNYIKMVEEFHNAFNAPILPTPQIPSKERCDLRINLMQEELNEIKEAIENDDLVEAADGFGDLMVVLCGSIIEFGLGDEFNNIFDEIHRSNMSKACSTEEEAKMTLEHYKQKDGTEGYYKQVGDKWVTYRNGDDKVLKSVGYSPANIKGMLNA